MKQSSITAAPASTIPTPYHEYLTACRACGGPVVYRMAFPGPGACVVRMDFGGKAEHEHVCELRRQRKDTFLKPDGAVDLGNLGAVYGDSVAQQVAKTLGEDGKPEKLPWPHTRRQIIAALPCSHCGAVAGEQCVDKIAEQPRKRVHDARMRAARREAIAWLCGM